jgi:hypothetical protein
MNRFALTSHKSAFLLCFLNSIDTGISSQSHLSPSNSVTLIRSINSIVPSGPDLFALADRGVR